jgi:hypothetical protein
MEAVPSDGVSCLLGGELHAPGIQSPKPALLATQSAGAPERRQQRADGLHSQLTAAEVAGDSAARNSVHRPAHRHAMMPAEASNKHTLCAKPALQCAFTPDNSKWTHFLLKERAASPTLSTHTTMRAL